MQSEQAEQKRAYDMQFIDLAAQYRALQTDIDNRIKTVLTHGKYIRGPEVAEFETELQSFIGIKHAITCANGTDALQLLYMAYGIGAGDAVFCPDVTFIASISPAVMLGAVPVLCDIDPGTFNLCPDSLLRQIQAVLAEGKLKPKAVVAVDLFGNPADYEHISSICKDYNLILIEDAAQSFGSSLKGTKCGAFGDSAIASFFPAKPLGCYGDGGAIFTNDDSIAGVCRSLCVHGKGPGGKYDNIRIGVNSRLDTLQAAILLPKLKALSDYEMDARQRVAKRYDDAFQSRFDLQKIKSGAISAYAQYSLLAKDSETRNHIMRVLMDKGIPSMVYYNMPLHALPVFEGRNAYSETFEAANDYCARTFSLPMHSYLNEEEQAGIINTMLYAVSTMI